MKIRKLFFIMIASVGLCLSLLPISSALTVDTPMEEPVFGVVDGENNIKLLKVGYAYVDSNGNKRLYYTENFPAYSNISINRNVIQVNNNHVRSEFYINGSTTSDFPRSERRLCIFDLDTGNLLQSSKGVTEDQNTVVPFLLNSYVQVNQGKVFGSDNVTYDIRPNAFYSPANASDLNSLVVNWARPEPEVPEQIQLKSPLSEPVADKYNSYAVLDDRIIWISWRINGIYTRSDSIENISEVYSYNAQINESGTGTYAGQQNGYTENIEIPTQSISGSYSGNSEDTSILTDGDFDQYGFYRGTVYDEATGYTNSSQGRLYLDNLYLSDMHFSGNHSGVTSGAIIPGIDFTGVNSGSVHFNSNGTVSLNDIEYYPVSFNHNDIFEYYRLYCLPTSSDNFVFWLAPDRSFVPLASNNQLLVNMDFYYSEFDLEGNYIRSEMHTVTETDIGLFDAFQPEEPIHSVKFYGIDFFNIDNLPFNLSSVLWQYDYEFKQWRDNMYAMLNSIYNVLANGNNVPEPDPKNQWAENLSDATPQNDLNVKPAGQEVALDNALGNLNFSPQNQSKFEQWAGLFSNGKLIACCIFALACGSVILTLGKKKSE